MAARKWTHKEAFAHFGATPRNPRWSWSARSSDDRTVVLTLWDDKFKLIQGGLLYRWTGLPEDARRKPAHRELMDNLGWARDHCGGRFKVIVATARNEQADPRSIKQCYPVNWSMRLIKFNPIAGTFTAEARNVQELPSEQMSRAELLAVVRQLPDRTPIATRLTPDHSAKQSWINWLSNYADHGDHPLRGQRDARFIYNHWWYMPTFIWLAEASGVDTNRIQRAARIAASSGNSTTQAASIRRILPWSLLVKHLLLKRAIAPTAFPRVQDNVVFDIEEVRNDRRISETTKETLIDARRGQGQFRADLVRRWNGLCAVTGCGISAMLRASHIKPWRKSTNRDRLNPANGILLAAHVDALFDCGLVSFADNGAVLVSAQIADDVSQFNLPNRLRRKLTKQEKQFLSYHRRHVFEA